MATKQTKFIVISLSVVLFIVGTTLAIIKAFFPELIGNKSEYNKKPHFVSDNKIHIVIDAGHGGPDPGAINKKTGDYEKNICSNIVTELVKMGDTNRYSILQTRPGDSNIHRHDRILMANKFKPNLLLSIHINSFIESYLNGFEIGFSDSSLNIVDSLSKPNPNYNTNKLLSNSLSNNIGYAFPQMKNRGIRVRKDRIWMIYAGEYPSILIEWGYISNLKDLAIIKDPNAHQLLAQSIWKTIDKHFEQNPIQVN